MNETETPTPIEAIETRERFWYEAQRLWQPDVQNIMGAIDQGAKAVIVNGPNGIGKTQILGEVLQDEGRRRGLRTELFPFAAETNIRSSVSSKHLFILDEFNYLFLDLSDHEHRQYQDMAQSRQEHIIRNLEVIGQNPDIVAVMYSCGSTDNIRQRNIAKIRELATGVGIDEHQLVDYRPSMIYLPNEWVRRYVEILGMDDEVAVFFTAPGNEALTTARALGWFEKHESRVQMRNMGFGPLYNKGIKTIDDLRTAFKGDSTISGSLWKEWVAVRIGGSYPALIRMLTNLEVIKPDEEVLAIHSEDDAEAIIKNDKTVSKDISRRWFELHELLKLKQEKIKLVEAMKNGENVGPATQKGLRLEIEQDSLNINTEEETEALRRLDEEGELTNRSRNYALEDYFD